MPTNQEDAVWRIRSAADLGRAIAGARRRRDVTQEQLAAELGIKRSYLSALENGEETIALERTLRALRRLGAEISIRQAGPGTDG